MSSAITLNEKENYPDSTVRFPWTNKAIMFFELLLKVAENQFPFVSRYVIKTPDDRLKYLQGKHETELIYIMYSVKGERACIAAWENKRQMNLSPAP
ncbi:hypothetical protein CDAR_253401 [Caerostris darwini]|uniref:Uncharacterized protein n=1 Tax=Caerostris darwini TaxID=1538125 RepID=A0AAV4U8K2_9ARAC|nr:hypothetical protein CDAR_253401 [Caerostris darwini]